MTCNLQESPGFLISRTAHSLRDQIARILKRAQLPVSAEEYAVLSIVTEASGPLRVGRLASLAARDATTVKRQLNALEKHALVELQRDPRDRRAVLVSATFAGRQLVERTQPACERLNDAVNTGLSEPELAVVVRALQRMHANLVELNKDHT